MKSLLAVIILTSLAACNPVVDEHYEGAAKSCTLNDQEFPDWGTMVLLRRTPNGLEGVAGISPIQYNNTWIVTNRPQVVEEIDGSLVITGQLETGETHPVDFVIHAKPESSDYRGRMSMKSGPTEVECSDFLIRLIDS